MLIRGYNDLPCLSVRDSLAAAQLVEPRVAPNTEGGFQEIFRIVHPTVDHLAVSRGGFAAEPIVALANHEVSPGARKALRDGQPDDPSSDHKNVNWFHAAAPTDR